MKTSAPGGLLGPDDPQPVAFVNRQGTAPFLLIGDHAGLAIPRKLGNLGVGEADLARHIGSDLGILALGRALAARLDAVFLHQAYSRLVIDCNRDPAQETAMPPVSDGTPVPANTGLSAVDRAARVAAIHTPYHAAIAAELDRRAAAGEPTILVALHSFTPVMAAVARPWQAGILHHLGDAAYALAVLAALRRRRPGLTVGDNEPYRMDGTDYTIPIHAYPRGLRYVEVEVRQDLLQDEAGQAEWCATLAEVLLEAAAPS